MAQTETSTDRPARASAAETRAARYQAVHRVTTVGAVVDFLLGVTKLVAGGLAQSQALIADGVHSLSDLVTDGFVIWAAKHAEAEADEEHPYGHERIETVATVALGSVLVLVGIGIALDAGWRLLHPELAGSPAWWAMIFAGISVVSKEAIYHYTMYYARRFDSALLEANAWHTRSDAASSLVVIVGIGGAQIGLTYLDGVAALVVAWMIGRIGFSLARKSVHELIDSALEPDEVEAIRATLTAVDGVRDLHMLRTRRMGPKSLVDVHVLLDDPKLSVSEGHQISETARARLIHKFRHVEDVTVHIDPEDDEEYAAGRHLGLRQEILGRLRARWAPIAEADAIQRVTLHYLDGAIYVELELPLAVAVSGDPDAIASRFREVADAEPDIEEIRLVYA